MIQQTVSGWSTTGRLVACACSQPCRKCCICRCHAGPSCSSECMHPHQPTAAPLMMHSRQPNNCCSRWGALRGTCSRQPRGPRHFRCSPTAAGHGWRDQALAASAATQSPPTMCCRSRSARSRQVTVVSAAMRAATLLTPLSSLRSAAAWRRQPTAGTAGCYITGCYITIGVAGPMQHPHHLHPCEIMKARRCSLLL